MVELECVIFSGIYLFLFIILWYIQHSQYKTFRNPLTFFSMLWCIIGFFANTSILDYYPPSAFVNLSIIIGIIVFSTVYIFLSRKSYIETDDLWNWGMHERISYKSIIFFNVFCWLMMIPRLSTAINILQTQGFAFLRANLTNADVGVTQGGALDIVWSYMVGSIFLATTILAIFLLFSKESKTKKYIFLIYSLISIILYALTAAARGIIIEIIFCFVLVVLVCKKNIVKNLWRNSGIRISLFIAIGAVVFITLQRGAWGQDNSAWFSVLQTFYVYYFSGPAYLTQLLAAQSEYALDGTLTYGMASFGFIGDWFDWFFRLLGSDDRGTLFLLGGVLGGGYYYVSPDILVNAMYTCFYVFMLDWGYLGIIIGPLFLAIYSSFLYKRLYSTRSLRIGVMYVYWLYTLIRTVFKLDTVTIEILIIFICMQLFIRRVHQEKEHG